VIFKVLADLTVAIHLAFVLFVIAGGLLVPWRPVLAWAHLPAAAWGAWIELSGGICPLTPLENVLRARGGGAVYDESFVERYLVPLIYPESLTRETQMGLGALVIVTNVAIYAAAVVMRRRRSRGRASTVRTGPS
jgi:hypothetical protein